MEFEDLITLIIFFAFFILPSIFKGRFKKKKSPGVKKKKTSLFGKLGDRIQNFIQDLERQAQEAKKQAQVQEQGSVWDELAEDGEMEFDPEEDLPKAPSARPLPESYDPDHPFIPPEKPVAPQPLTAETTPPAEPLLPPVRASLPAHSLRQAVVWSEILGKPVALRNE